MTVLPHGVIRARYRGRITYFLVRHVNWVPSITVIGMDGQLYDLPTGNYPPASAREAEHFWLTLEQSLHTQHHTRSRN